MKMFWFFRLRFRRAYDSGYDSDFPFLLGHELSYDSNYDSDSVDSENQPEERTCDSITMNILCTKGWFSLAKES